jgi:hypothetical protein
VSDKIVKVTNKTKGTLPVGHDPKDASDQCIGRGCDKCVTPMWNRVEFPFKRGETIVVKENVGLHLQASWPGKIVVTAGPFDTTQLLSAPEGFFEHDPVTNKFKALTVRTDTSPRGSSQDPAIGGETLEDARAAGRLVSRGGDDLRPAKG